MSKHILFLSGFFPDEIRTEIINNSRSHIQFAADALQKSILKGLLIYYPDLTVVNMPFVAPFPTHNKSPFIRSFKMNQRVLDGTNVGYLNLVGYKYHDIYTKARSHISAWVEKNSGKKTILVYAAYLPFIKAVLAVKNTYDDVKVCLILPDLPQYMNQSGNIISNFIIKQNNKKLQQAFYSIDQYILLTEHMAEKLPTKGKAWTVVEGIFDDYSDLPFIKSKKSEKKSILYTGTLARRYGILTLIDAFGLIRNENYELIICGDGDAKTEIAAAAKKDNRIMFKGAIDRPVVLEMQKEASLLINPRMPEGEFTKFSFPSKTMEYLASGTPALLFRLPGIPGEYYQYCFTPDEYSARGLAKKVVEVLRLSSTELEKKGQDAREFILNNKNPKVQCKKIFDLIEEQ